jgi:hypothetical protein
MIARSFRPVGWVAAVGAAALGCYMLSLRVASERADLDRLNHRIVAASQNIRSLQTELGTRGRMHQLEAWNEEVLALSAPVSGQFVEGNVSLARFDTRQPQSAVETPAQLASATVPPPAARPAAPAPQQAVAPTPTPAQPLVRRASATIPATTAPVPTVAAPKAATPVTAATTRRATAPATTEPASAAATPRRTATAAPIRTAARDTAAPPRTPAKRTAATPETRTAATPARNRPTALLDDRTVRALGSASRAERGGGTRD